jgi:hypothetical protein
MLDILIPLVKSHLYDLGILQTRSDSRQDANRLVDEAVGIQRANARRSSIISRVNHRLVSLWVLHKHDKHAEKFNLQVDRPRCENEAGTQHAVERTQTPGRGHADTRPTRPTLPHPGHADFPGRKPARGTAQHPPAFRCRSGDAGGVGPHQAPARPRPPGSERRVSRVVRLPDAGEFHALRGEAHPARPVPLGEGSGLVPPQALAERYVLPRASPVRQRRPARLLQSGVGAGGDAEHSGRTRAWA